MNRISNETLPIPAAGETPLARLLAGYTVEVTSRDVDAVLDRLLPGTEVYVANLPKDGMDMLVAAAARLKTAGMVPVPHIVARKLSSRDELETLVARLAGEAGVERVLSLGGDRDEPAGPFAESLALIESGVFERNGIRHVSIACYPEGHPRISEPALAIALRYKVAALTKRGIEARLVSQFGFEAAPVLDFVRGLRETGVTTPFRVGVAGPAQRAQLVRYALRCGVGASLRAITERKGLVSSLFGGAVTPEGQLTEIADALRRERSLGIEGVHFFTFGAPANAIEWARDRTG